MRHFVVSPLAAEDLNDIWEYVAQEWDEAHADATLRQCITAFGDLAELPGKGHLRQDLTRHSLHFFPIDPYVIIYRRDSSPLAIHAVLHASRNIKKLLRKRSLHR